MDAGPEYDLKHANIEKAFGVTISDSGIKILSRFAPGPLRDKFKRKANGKGIPVSAFAAKRRILNRSALAARYYFSFTSQEKFDCPNSFSVGFNDTNGVSHLLESTCRIGDVKNMATDNLIEEVNEGKVEHAAHDVIDTGVLDDKWKMDSEYEENSAIQPHSFSLSRDPFLMCFGKLFKTRNSRDKHSYVIGDEGTEKSDSYVVEKSDPHKLESKLYGTLNKLGTSAFSNNLLVFYSEYLAGPFQRLKLALGPVIEGIVAEFFKDEDEGESTGIEKTLPVTLDSVHFKSGSLMLLGYGDREPRQMDNVNGHIKFQNHYGRLHVQLSGSCRMWRSDIMAKDGGWLSTDVFVDIVEQNWHANLNVVNIFSPLFEWILEIPIMWSKGRATGEVHICMSRGESFPSLHGQLDVTGLGFKIYDAPSWFSEISASLCFRGQRIFLHITSGFFGDVPLESSGDFGIHPEEGEFHLMCQVPCVEVNALMKTLKTKPLLFPVAGSVTAVFNCQGPLDAPVFVGSGLVSRKIISQSISHYPISAAYEAMIRSKDAGAVAAIDRIPFFLIFLLISHSIPILVWLTCMDLELV